MTSLVVVSAVRRCETVVRSTLKGVVILAIVTLLLSSTDRTVCCAGLDRVVKTVLSWVEVLGVATWLRLMPGPNDGLFVLKG